MSDTINKRSPDDFDWPATIVLYVILIILGIGLCFCLQRANRLIPNRFSFPLIDRATTTNRQTGLFDLGAEEEGLLSHYSDVEDDDDAEIIQDQNALRNNNNINNNNNSRYEDDEDEDEDEEQIYNVRKTTTTKIAQGSEEDEEEEFGNLQAHDQENTYNVNVNDSDDENSHRK